MPAAVMKVLHNVAAEYPDDLKKEIFKAVGKIDHIEVFGQEILCAAFIQSPFFGNGMLVKGDKEQNEDKWQSKCFLVLKLGDKVEKAAKEQGLALPRVGDWCFGNVQEHFQLSVRGTGSASLKDPKEPNKNVRPWGDAGWPCRLVMLSDLRGRTTRPQDVM